MRKLTLSFLQQLIAEGTFGNTAPTHVRLNGLYAPMIHHLLMSTKTGEMMAAAKYTYNGAEIVFTEEVDEDSVEVVNIRYLRPIRQDPPLLSGYCPADLHRKLTFTRPIEGLRVCSACGQEITP